MGLADEAAALVKRTGPECSLSKALAALPAEDAAWLREQIALRLGGVPARAISEALKGRGIHFSSQQVGHHRRGSCVRCGDESR